MGIVNWPILNPQGVYTALDDFVPKMRREIFKKISLLKRHFSHKNMTNQITCKIFCTPYFSNLQFLHKNVKNI